MESVSVIAWEGGRTSWSLPVNANRERDTRLLVGFGLALKEKSVWVSMDTTLKILNAC